MRDQHLSRERRLALAEGSLAPAENAEIADHLFHCSFCWQASVSALTELELSSRPDATDRERLSRIQSDAALSALLQRFRLEQKRLEEGLLARAAVGELRPLSKKSRREEIVRRKALRTRAVVEELLAEARRSLPLEAEEWASMSILLCRQLSASDFTESARADLMAECCIELASARRRAARWNAARQAIKEGREYAMKGSKDSVIEGNLIALEGVIDGDIGSLDDAEKLLCRARDFFEAAGESSLVGKALAQLAYIWVDADPEKSLRYLREARSVISPNEIRLLTLCEINRIDCLVTLGKTREALVVFFSVAVLCEQVLRSVCPASLAFSRGKIVGGP